MILRLFLILGLGLLGFVTYFTVIDQPLAFQAIPAQGDVVRLQQAGLIPTGDPEENEEVEHGIFDVPAMDEMMLEQAMAAGGMAGMDMSGMAGMDMGGASATDDDMMTMADGTKMPASAMGTAPEGEVAMSATDDGMMTMADGTKMPASAMGTAPEGEVAMSATDDDMMTMADGTKMPASAMGTAPEGEVAMSAAEGAMTMADGSTMPMSAMSGAELGEGGLLFAGNAAFDREIELSMSEWSFSNLNVDVKQGERIRFTVRNDGQILHEFMFMTMAGMTAVNYRAKRADWNLLEHEALYEKSLLLPGGEVSFVVEVQETGVWMFMCMLPYHMQMGMMGQMATEGMAMEM